MSLQIFNVVFLQASAVEKIKTNIQNSTSTNWWATKDIRDMCSSCHIRHALNLEIVRRTLFTIFWLGISYRGDPNRKQSILAQKSQQVIFTMIFYQNSNAVCSKVNKVQKIVNKVRRQFLSSTRVKYGMKDTFVNST